MKVFKFFAFAIIALIATSCGTSYNDAKAENLLDKFKEDKELSKEEWKEATDLFIAYMDMCMDEFKAAIKKSDTKREYETAVKDFMSKYPNGLALGFLLGMNEANLPAECTKKLNETEKKNRKVQAEIEKELEKKFG